MNNLKLNLECGLDAILGYRNIDSNPLDKNLVEKGDFRNLDALGIQNNSVSEIRVMDALRKIHISQIREILIHWINKLQNDGEIYIQGYDYAVLGNLMAYGNIDPEEINRTLYGNAGEKSPIGIYSLPVIEKYIREMGLTVKSKGLKGINFYIIGIKNQINV